MQRGHVAADGAIRREQKEGGDHTRTIAIVINNADLEAAADGGT